MSGTCGPRSFISSSSATLTLFLVNRLRAKTASAGSTLYKLTWKQRSTPQQHLIYSLRASTHRISNRDYIGWPTPTAGDWKDGRECNAAIKSQLVRLVWLTGSVGHAECD
ncbi:hypothetical protein ARAF_2333 [Arsenophonus endosymbiont of Aleurodicus floccissimus]|nr:hypothetical protein ARAF_2333 [Arsenophonus endosymbiont of Aleurodicus floccissimus]